MSVDTVPTRPERTRVADCRLATMASPDAQRFGQDCDACPGGGCRVGPGRSRYGRVDWSQVAMFRSQASERLSAALGEDPGRLDREGQRELGRSIILELLQAEAAAASSAGRRAVRLGAEQDRLATAVFDALFGLGRLQPLVDDDRVENIIITGHDNGPAGADRRHDRPGGSGRRFVIRS